MAKDDKVQLDKVAYLSLAFLVLQLWEYYPLKTGELETITYWFILFAAGVYVMFFLNSLRGTNNDTSVDYMFFFVFGAIFGTIGEYYTGYFLDTYRGEPLWTYDHDWVYTSTTSIILWGFAAVMFMAVKQWVEGRK